MSERPTEVSNVRRGGGQALFEAERLERASWAHTTRRVNQSENFTLSQHAIAPKPGDLVLARIDLLGHHGGLQLWSGRRKNLFPGDEIVVAYGNRYAPSQFEAVVPNTLGPCHLVAGGGIAAKALSWHSRVRKGPTLITPIGLLLKSNGEPANLADYAMNPIDMPKLPTPPTIAVVGTAMDAGKTDTAAFLVRGLTQMGLQVGFAKVTGTGAGGDTWLLRDAGANPVVDFTDAGFASTFRVSVEEIEGVLTTLVGHLMKSGADVIVVEVADGVLQPETAALLESETFASIVGGILFTARDAMGAVAGVEWLNQRELPVVGISGVLTAAPLQCVEATGATGHETYTREDLGSADIAREILAKLEETSLTSGETDVQSVVTR